MNPLTLHIDPMGIWHIALFSLTLLCSVFIIHKHFKSIGLCASLLWVYVLTYSLFIVEFPYPLYGTLNTAFQARTGSTLIECLVVPLAILLAPSRAILVAIPWLVAINLMCVWIWGKGIMGWSSFDNAIIAACLPFLWTDSRVKKLMCIAAVITMCSMHGNTALIIILAQLLALSIHFKWIRKWFLLLIPVAFFFAHKHHVNPNFDTGDRVRQWVKIFNFWKDSNNVMQSLLGFGPGSFLHLSLLMDKFQAPSWLHAHQDYLQILFETGMIGLTLAIGTVITAIKRAWYSPRILASVFGVCAFAVSYHPARFAAGQALICLIFKEALQTKKPLTNY